MRLTTLVGGAAAAALIFGTGPRLPALAQATGPGIAYLSAYNGGVTVRRGDSGAVVAAGVNAPLEVGDYLFTDRGARSEVQFDYGHVLRVAPDSQVRFERLGPSADAVQLASGAVDVSVLHPTSEYTEIETPSVAVRPRAEGLYRVAVDDRGVTSITVRSGEAAVLLPQGTQMLGPGSTLSVWGPQNQPLWHSNSPYAEDAFDRWALDRDGIFDRSTAYQYTPNWIPGAYTLTQYGSWQNVPTYGNAWFPSDVPAGWTPYSNGQWAWEPYYGWTWVDNDPWGYAPFHYGRWFYAENVNRWAWDPGPVQAPPQTWAPALVAFLGFGGGNGVGFGLSLVNNVAWVPLAPNETLSPWWGPNYAAYPSATNVTYNVTNVRYVYVNSRWRNAVRGVPRLAFASGSYRRCDPVPVTYLNHVAIVRNGLPIVPGRESLRYTHAPLVTRHIVEAPAFRSFRTVPHSSETFAQQRNTVVAYRERVHITPVAGSPNREAPRFAPNAQQRHETPARPAQFAAPVHRAPQPQHFAAPRPAPAQQHFTAPRPAPVQQHYAAPRPVPVQQHHAAPRPAPVQQRYVAPRPAPVQEHHVAPQPAPVQQHYVAPRPAPVQQRYVAPRPAPVQQQRSAPVQQRYAAPQQQVRPAPQPAAPQPRQAAPHDDRDKRSQG